MPPIYSFPTETTPTGLGRLPEVIEGTPGGMRMSGEDLGRLFELAEAGNPQARSLITSPQPAAAPTAGASNINALYNQARQGDEGAARILRQLQEDDTARRRLEAATEYDRITKQRSRNDRLRERTITAGLNFLKQYAGGGTLEQVQSVYDQANQQFAGGDDMNPARLPAVIAAAKDARVAEQMREEAETEYWSNPTPENFSKVKTYIAMGPGGQEAANKWADQTMQERRDARNHKMNQLKDQIFIAKQAFGRFQYTPSKGIMEGTSQFAEARALEGSYDLDAKNPFAGVSEPEAMRFEQARQRAMQQYNRHIESVLGQMGVPTGDQQPRITQQTAEQDRQALEAQQETPTPPVEGAQFGTAAEIQEALQTGRLQFGKPFRFADGTIRVITSNGTPTIVGQWQ